MMHFKSVYTSKTNYHNCTCNRPEIIYCTVATQLKCELYFIHGGLDITTYTFCGTLKIINQIGYNNQLMYKCVVENTITLKQHSNLMNFIDESGRPESLVFLHKIFISGISIRSRNIRSFRK